MAMNKLNVGDYMRTPKGIGKIENIEIDKQDTIIYLDCGITIDYITKDFTEEEINKMYPSSSKTIDILEIGDFLNGWRVNNIEKNNDGSGTIIKIGNTTFNVLDNEDIYTPVHETDSYYQRIEKLKTIATHEQFENISYKVGE